MDFFNMLFGGLIRLVFNQFIQFFLEPIRFFEGVLLSVFHQGATVELGLHPPHVRREATVAIVAIGVSPFGFAALGKPMVGGM
jgi:hypothetical protein